MKRYGHRMSILEINSGDLDFETRMNPNCCLGFSICPYSGDHAVCYNPLDLVNALDLVYESKTLNEIQFSHLRNPGVTVCTDGSGVWCDYENGQREVIESIDNLIEAFLK